MRGRQFQRCVLSAFQLKKKQSAETDEGGFGISKNFRARMENTVIQLVHLRHIIKSFIQRSVIYYRA